MRYIRLLLFAVIASTFVFFLQDRSAHAVFHCMRIHAVMAGFNGDNDIQYVELRMSLSSQNSVSGHRIRFFDAAGTLKATFTFPGNVSNALNGDSILIGTQEFNDATAGGDANFTFSGNTTGANGGDPLHPIQTPGGKVAFADDPGPSDFNCNGNTSLPADSVAYGSFAGTVDYGTPAPALPSPSDNRALRVSNINQKPSNNSTEYSLQDVSTTTFSVSSAALKSNMETPRNNGRVVLQLEETEPVGGVAERPDVASASPAATKESRGNAFAVTLAAVAASTGALLLGGAAWYARKRRA